jgi:LPS export ABC transporter permease LptF/LPS export ABC transporter permease LptG
MGFSFPRPRILDRYIVREMVAPTSLGLLVFTFILLIDQIPRLLAILVARSADLWTIVRVFLNLLPSILAVTVPMAFLLGVLLAFGRLASDSEIVALRAVGVSPLRLLGPVLLLSTGAFLLTLYINAVALPAANQAHRELVFNLVITKARTVVKPRTFTDELLPGKMMLYVSDIDPQTSDWRNLLIYDTQKPNEPRLLLARTGRIVIQKERQSVRLELADGTEHSFVTVSPRDYRQSRFITLGFDLPFDEFFPKLPLAKGDREMTLGELQAEIGKRRGQGQAEKEWGRFAVEWHKKFAIPTACFVFGLLGLGLSLGSKKEARSAAFALSIVVIFIYYVLIRLGEQAGDTGLLSPFLAMWSANIVLGVAAAVLLFLNHREAAFDPLDVRHYLALVPTVRRQKATSLGRAAAARAPRPVVVVRIPRLSVRFPTLLDRYVIRRYLGFLVLILAGFVAIFVLADFMDLFDDIQHNNVKGKVVVHYYAFFLFQVLFTVSPVAVLVTVLVTLGVLARRNEITAMKAGGISIYRAAAPVLALGVLTSGLLLAMQEVILPSTNRAAEADRNVIKGRPPQSSGMLDRRWILASDGHNFYNYDFLTEATMITPGPRGQQSPTRPLPGASPEFSLYGLSIYAVDPDTWNLRERTYVARAVYDRASRSYELERGWRRVVAPPGSFRAFESERVRARGGGDPGGEIEPPSYFEREARPSDTMGFADLRREVASLRARGFDVAQLSVELHRKLAFPNVGIVMTLIGIPFSFVVARRGALYGIGVSIVIGIFYWACLGIFEALGKNALLAPVLAAWAPNLLFTAAGLYLMFTLDT